MAKTPKPKDINDDRYFTNVERGTLWYNEQKAEQLAYLMKEPTIVFKSEFDNRFNFALLSTAEQVWPGLGFMTIERIAREIKIIIIPDNLKPTK